MASEAVALSVVVPVFDEEEGLPTLYERLTQALTPLQIRYEVLLVDDGSRDRSWSIIEELHRKDLRVRGIRLSRNFGHQTAITAGVDLARGAAVGVMDADLQDPPEVLVEMWRRLLEGHDVVYAQRRRRAGEALFKRATAALFYRVVRTITSIDIPVDTGDFRVMSRRAVEGLKQIRERHRFMRGLVSWVGLRQLAFPYDRAARVAGTTKFPVRKMVSFAADAIASFSIAPLRLATGFGFLVSAAAFLYAGYAIYLKVVRNISLPGWASLMVAVVFLGGVQLLCLGIIGEYLGRVYDEVKARPLYVLDTIHADEQSDG